MSPEMLTAVAAVVVALAALVGAVVTGLVARATSIRAANAAEGAKAAAEASHAEIVETKAGVFELGRQVDGRLSELLAQTRLSSRAEGVLAGEQAQRDRASGPQ